MGAVLLGDFLGQYGVKCVKNKLQTWKTRSIFYINADEDTFGFFTKKYKKLLTFLFDGANITTTTKYVVHKKCDEQKPVGWKEPGESCRLVRGNGGVLLEFILLAVH